MREGPERWSGNLLRKFLEDTRSFPPVSGRVVQGVLPAIPSQPLSGAKVPRRQRQTQRTGHRGEAGKEVLPRKKWKSSNGGSL